MEKILQPRAQDPKFSLLTLTKNSYRFITDWIKINHLLILLFVYTAATKIQHYAAFKGAMFKSPILRPHINTLAWLIPSIEIAVSILLLFEITKRIGYYAALVLMTVFTAYIIFILIKYSGHLPCNCGGVISLLSWPQHLVFNIGFLALTARAIYLTRKPRPLLFTLLYWKNIFCTVTTRRRIK